MERAIYEVFLTGEQEAILEKVKDNCSKSGMGVTLNGNRLTVRFYHKKELVDVHMIIESITDGQPEPIEEDK